MQSLLCFEEGEGTFLGAKTASLGTRREGGRGHWTAAFAFLGGQGPCPSSGETRPPTETSVSEQRLVCLGRDYGLFSLIDGQSSGLVLDEN